MRSIDIVFQQLVDFLNSRHEPLLHFAKGQQLQQVKGDHELILLVSGSVRYLDDQRLFGTYTLGRTQTPLLTGVISWFSPDHQESCIASTDCTGYSLQAYRDHPLVQEYLTYSFRLNLLLPEFTWLANGLLSAGFLTNGQPASLERLIDQCKIVSSLDQIDRFSEDSVFYFADESSKGFVYGQLLTPSSVKKFWVVDEVLPRIIGWSPSQPSSPFASSSSLKIGASTPLSPDLSESESQSQSDSVSSIGSSETFVDTTEVIAQTYPYRRPHDTSRRHEALLFSLLGHFKVPVRKDLISRAGTFLNAKKDQLSLDSYLRILEEFGLEVRKISISSDQLIRLPLPCVLLDLDRNPLLLIQSNSKQIQWIDPLIGFQKASPSDLPVAFQSVREVLQVSSGRFTPQSVFGLSWILPLLAKYKLQLIEVFTASFLTQLFALATPLLFQQIIDRVIGKGSHDSLAGLAVLMVIFSLLEIIFSSLRTFQFADISNRIDIRLGSSIISRMLRIDARYFEKRPVGELSSRLNELDSIRRFLTGTALTVVLDVIFATLYIAVMFFYSVSLTLVILATVPLLVLATVGLTPITKRLLRSRAEAYAKGQSYMVELLNGIQTVKVQNSQSMARLNWEKRHLQTINSGFKTVIANTASNNILQLVNKISGILVIAVGSWLVINNQLTLGELIAFRIISGYVTQPLLRLASAYQGFQEASLSFERLSDLVNQPLESGPLDQSTLSMPPLVGKVTFDSVSFSYSQASAPQLSGVSLTIPPSSFTGIVGQSGCGKSTLLKLLPRLYYPSSGRVLIDDLDISKVDLYSLRAQLGFVPQDCLLFEGSIYSNIAVNDPDVDPDRVLQASRLACAHDFIMTLPQGYSTTVGEKGSGLSGGQRQRIALARMLLQSPNMLILDEATSALDADTERQVVDNIRATCSGKTLLMITHRLSTLQHADQIVVMHQGRIDSVGTHQELMDLGGRYFVLYQQQFGGEVQ